MTRPPGPKNGNQTRHDDQGPDDLGQVRLHKRQVAKQVTCEQQPDHPDHTTENVVGGELAAGHLGHARHKGHKGADERHEARQHDGDATVLFIKRVRLIKRLAIEKARVLPAKHLGPEVAPDGVVGLVPRDRCRQQQAHGQRQAHQLGPAQRPHDEEQRVARQKRHHHQTGLDEHDQEQQRIDPGAVLAHKSLQVAVHMEDEIDELQEDVHAPIIPAPTA